MNKVALDDDIKAEGLSILGDLPVSPSDPVPEGTRSILMLGPDEPNFWKIFKDSRESVSYTHLTLPTKRIV